MKRYSALFLCALLLGIALVTQAQDEPVPTRTVDEAVQTLLAQTSQAPNMTQTVQRALEDALTATAQAGTPQAATPEAPTAVPVDVDSLEVVNTTELDLMAGPGNTAAFLAPDGERFVYLADDTLCLYAQDATEPNCIDLPETLHNLDPESIVWSPDSRTITFTENFFLYFVDADIWVWDTTTDAPQNLTDDGPYRIDISADTWKNIDVAPTWLADGRILFLRYNRVDKVNLTPEIHAIAPDGSGLEMLGTLDNAAGFAAYALDAQGERLVYNFFRGGESETGLWTSGLDGSGAQQVFVGEEELQPMSVAVSPDGRYALISTPPSNFGQFTPETSMIRLVDLESGEGMLIDPERYVVAAGWSPDGSALAYVVNDRANPDDSGLYISGVPGEAGRLVFEGAFNAPTPRLRQPLTWGANNTILISNSPERGIVLVELGS